MTLGLFTLTGRLDYGRRFMVDVFMASAAGKAVREVRNEHVEVAGAPEYTPAMAPPFRSPQVRYSSAGPLRGKCGHKHRHIDDAVECLDADDAWCIERGGRTDRKLYALASPGGRRELDADELAAVELYRRSIGKPKH
jgi:hypothetical protein